MSDRHEKWVRVEPGTVIPAGQPYRVEYDDGSASEFPNLSGVISRPEKEPLDGRWFVDSSWRPPLELPTEPTWGIAVAEWAKFGSRRVAFADNWTPYAEHLGGIDTSIPLEHVLDFIPLTDEQIARIKAAR